MDLLINALQLYGPLALAGAFGGFIRWWSAREPLKLGLGSVAVGAIIGTYFGPAFFTLVQPAADFSGMDPQDARLLGAHLCGVIGINLYAIPADIVRARANSIKASIGKDTP